jgi:shikimate kinase
MKPGETLDDVFAQRSPLYEKYADMVIDCENVTFEENLEKLINALDK